MDEDSYTRLLSAPWNCVKANDDNVYYLKYHTDNTGYRLLVTDLRRVWYDAANARALKKQASSHRLVIDDDEQLQQLLKHLETFLHDVKGKCQVEQMKEGQELRIRGSESQGFATLAWTFMCKALLAEAPTMCNMTFHLESLMKHVF
ncbi:hypothetical protein BDB00DRAFT_187064 [Zychaea mexicana]|uniref:uncharacterized protein n=1 Tax=Zychaea mexicana TaxID=64656 RepID=UPI0022FE26FB|nr:uncharacterized protein BDB00DRAFT_187064 [Zychaea mexicana]KAI9477699.1 hypothetical protein BDB00DRAFT_187064 [Zychaea mexicana]